MILAVPKGGMSGKTRKRYAIRQKLQVLEECCQLRSVFKLSLRGAAAKLGISHSLLIRWTAKVPTLIAAHMKIRKSVFESTASQLESIKEELLMWISVRHERGMSVTTQEVIMKALSMLKDAFVGKSFKA
jgi:hypothetical protein